MSSYHRYHIETEPIPNLAGHPNRFVVKVRRVKLAELLIKELLRERFDLAVVASRPCVYGVFSRPIGGFAPKPQFCVGCLRCTVQYPDVVQIHPNPARLELGDSFMTPDQVDTILYEAASGRVPVRGAGYRGPFAGPGWDGLWTDMSEIVRPTRDGIHGREFISTSVDLGSKPAFLDFDSSGNPTGATPKTIILPIPCLFDPPPTTVSDRQVWRAFSEAAGALKTLMVLPVRSMLELALQGPQFAPVVTPANLADLDRLSEPPRMIELEGWQPEAFEQLQRAFPKAVVGIRMPYSDEVVELARRGVGLLHLTADYHGGTGRGFVMDAIRAAHESLVAEGLREQVTLVGSGGIAAAEHVPKAILCGLDAVALDTPLLIALQGRFRGECADPLTAEVEFPALRPAWGAQRLCNLVASWRDQLLEILGAMGLREVRRLRGELGRAMFHADLEREAFASIQGFEG